MLAKKLFELIERDVPLSLAVTGDTVGFLGPGDPEEIEVEKVDVMLDLIQADSDADLIVCHHPPPKKPKIPTYVIHSNWDIVSGGANDDLAERLELKVVDVFDKKTGIGRICTISTTLDEFIKKIINFLPVDTLKIIEGKDKIKKVAIVSGFGLNPKYIELAHKCGVDLYLSGDLTHHGAILARKLNLSVVDATHYATEVPGLLGLCDMISTFGIETRCIDTGIPWKTYLSDEDGSS
jgi:dinuclear metal center YbgI/SA1388 family protein